MGSTEKIVEQINGYYDSWFEMNRVYHEWAKQYGIQDTTLFVLHAIKNTASPCNQSQLCNMLCLPKQTVSQILSHLEKEGYIVKETTANDRRNKTITFTEKGLEFAIPILEKLKSAETEAFLQLSQEQRSSIIESFALLSDSLGKNLLK